MGYLLFTKQRIKDLLGVTSGEVIGDSQTGTLTNKTIESGLFGGNPSGNIFRGGHNPSISGKMGTYYGIGSTTAEGVLNAGLTSIGTDSGTSNTTEGRGRVKATGAVANNNAGFRQTFSWAQRSWNPYLACKIQISSTSNIRAFIGFSSDTAEIAGETTLNNFSGFGVGKRVADTNWFTYRNDGDATEDRVDSGIAFSTSVITLEMELTDNPAEFKSMINGVLQTTQTTEIPAQTTGLFPHIEIETSDAVDKNITIYWWYVRSAI